MKTLFFAGSFDPFTIGHADIVSRGLQLADNVIIGVGFNCNKPCGRESLEKRIESIERLYAADERVKVVSYSGLTATTAIDLGATALLRGVRDVRDFEYERTIADVNRRMFGIETILLFADPALASLSSTVVKELESNGCDVSSLLPEAPKPFWD